MQRFKNNLLYMMRSYYTYNVETSAYDLQDVFSEKNT